MGTQSGELPILHELVGKATLEKQVMRKEASPVPFKSQQVVAAG